MNRIYVLTSLALMFACDRHDSGELALIDSEIKVETREVLGPGERTLTLHCSTERIYECSNYSISTEAKRHKGSFDVSFKSVEIGPICSTSLGPATSIVDLGMIPTGNYNFVFRNGARKSEGTLAISDGRIELIFPEKNGLAIERPLTRRVPPNTYWGTIGYSASTSATLADKFIQSLRDQGAAFEKQTPGHYFYYEIDDKGSIVIEVEKTGYYFAKGMIFQYHGIEDDIREFVRSDGGKLRDKLTIDIQTSVGTRMNNWE